jgi:hypothetical protein
VQRRNYYKDDPRWIIAKYAGKCFCGKEIKPGDTAMYYPRGKTVACEDCGCATEVQLIDEDNNESMMVR